MLIPIPIRPLTDFNRPFHIDDTVQIENVFGKVKAMEFRYTKITTFDGRNVYIPNSDVLTKPVFNYTEDGFYRSDFIVGIAYENDIEKAKELILSCIEEEKAQRYLHIGLDTSSTAVIITVCLYLL